VVAGRSGPKGASGGKPEAPFLVRGFQRAQPSQNLGSSVKMGIDLRPRAQNAKSANIEIRIQSESL
jgi:hypothetical protein